MYRTIFGALDGSFVVQNYSLRQTGRIISIGSLQPALCGEPYGVWDEWTAWCAGHEPEEFDPNDEDFDKPGGWGRSPDTLDADDIDTADGYCQCLSCNPPNMHRNGWDGTLASDEHPNFYSWHFAMVAWRT